MARHFEVHEAHPTSELLHAAACRLPHTCGRDLSLACDPEGEAVTIAGSVGSYYEKQLVQESLREAAGSWAMHNELYVV
ncbi:MAG: hypothetical protein AAF532_05990 [Planctomycetota bacterium]